jgi:uncharacterized membrane protein
MERKLYRGIMWPSMIATLITAHFLLIGVMQRATTMKPCGSISKSVGWTIGDLPLCLRLLP